jgi:hypothetical protein
MGPFVGISKQLLSVPQLRELMIKLDFKPSYYFFRWAHTVSGILDKLPSAVEFPMVEGQLFNAQWELRWKYKEGNCYEVLLLSVSGEHPDFLKVGEEWKTQDRSAHLYPSTEARFPKSVTSANLNLAQRYFIDIKTATVHFIALTVRAKPCL